METRPSGTAGDGADGAGTSVGGAVSGMNPSWISADCDLSVLWRGIPAAEKRFAEWTRRMHEAEGAREAAERRLDACGADRDRSLTGGPLTSSAGIVVRKFGLLGLLVGSVPDELRGMRVVSSVSEGVRVATSGMTVYVLPGEYRESVVVDKDVMVVGYGYAPTGSNGAGESALGVRLIGSDAGPALMVKNCKAIVCGLQLENVDNKMNALEVMGGSGWVIERCSISGKSCWVGYDNAGVVIKDAAGSVKSCTVSACEGFGVVVEGTSSVTMERCRFSHNKYSAVRVTGKSIVRLVECESVENHVCGLTVVGKSVVVVDRCRVSANRLHGVEVGDESNVRLVDCECRENGSKFLGGCGLAAGGESVVVAERCKMMRNKSHGGELTGKAVARLVECEFVENGTVIGGGCGLSTASESNVIAERCKSVRNDGHGLKQVEKSLVRMTECECMENGGSGIDTANDSHCFAEQCCLVNNRLHSAAHCDSSALELKECTLEGNASGDSPIR
jgi:hypothetical protein